MSVSRGNDRDYPDKTETWQEDQKVTDETKSEDKTQSSQCVIKLMFSLFLSG
jgi:hypothetical protein